MAILRVPAILLCCSFIWSLPVGAEGLMTRNTRNMKKAGPVESNALGSFSRSPNGTTRFVGKHFWTGTAEASTNSRDGQSWSSSYNKTTGTSVRHSFEVGKRGASRALTRGLLAAGLNPASVERGDSVAYESTYKDGKTTRTASVWGAHDSRHGYRPLKLQVRIPPAERASQ
jgi:hypothetical protein